MKNLYLLRRSTSNPATFQLLAEAASKKGLTVHDMCWDQFDFSSPPKLTNEDGLFALSFDRGTKIMERVLLNEEVHTFYNHYTDAIAKPDNVVGTSLLLQKAGVDIIPTIFSLSKDKNVLKSYVDALGGFPVIVKSAGGSHGRGVMKIDSLDSLASVCDYLLTLDHDFVLRAFIPHTKQARLIVVGDQVVASHQNYATLDFRSNVGPNELRTREVVDFSTEICHMAVQAVRTLHYEFGGVDILFHNKTNKPYIAEVNFPCFFPSTQQLTGVDIAMKMIEHLMKKSTM